MTDLIKSSVWPWEKTDLIKRLLAEETDLTDCAADRIEQTEAKLTKAVEALQWYANLETHIVPDDSGPQPIDLDRGDVARAALAELEEKK